MKKILIISPAWIGDAIMADSLYQRLQVKYPHCQIDVLGPRSVKMLYQRMPSVSHAMEMPLGHGQFGLRQRYRLGESLRSQHYDIAYVLPNSWKSALVPWFAKIPQRVGWWGEMRYGLLNDGRRLDKTVYPLMVQRFTALGYDKGEPWNKFQYALPTLTVDHAAASETLTAIATRLNVVVDGALPILALCPGAAYGPTKRWPARYFAEVAKQKRQDGYQVWLLAGPDDKNVCDEIDKLTDYVCWNLSGKTTLLEVIDLLALVDQVVANDTGLMHAAAALKRPIIAIFGSTSPTCAPPLSDNSHIVSNDDLPCKPCFQRECPLGHMKCLNDITPAEVLNLLQ